MLFYYSAADFHKTMKTETQMTVLKSTFVVYLASCLISCFAQETNGACVETADIDQVDERDYDSDYNEQQPSYIVNSIRVTCHSITLRDGPVPPQDLKIHTCSFCPETLKITESRIAVIPPTSFTNYLSTTILDIKSNGVEKILPGAFNSLNSLTELYLSFNNLTSISEGIFNSLDKLKTLDLSSNFIQSISPHSFTGANNLEILNLSSNALQFADSNIFIYMKQLKVLDLSYNQLSIFNFSIISDALQTLKLRNNHIHNAYGCLKTLSILDLSHNLLTSFQNSVCENNKRNIIFSLNLGHNLVSSLGNISTFNNLRYLSLKNNNISSIPNGFFSSLHSLTFLNLSSNGLEQFQYGVFDGLSFLQTLDVSHNQLTSFKKYNYHLLKNLRELYINHNKIDLFDSKDLTGILINLRAISLDDNNFSCDMLIEIFHNLKNITIPSGHSFHDSNIHGIACSDTDYNSDIPPESNFSTNRAADETSRKMLDKIVNYDFTKSGLYNYFNRDFKNSNFYKYLEDLKLVGNVTTNNNIKIFDTVKDIKKSQDNFSRGVNSYFNNDFRNTSFAKYLENFKKSEDMLNNGFTNSVIYNYFNKDFVNSNFYKYLESLKKPQFAIKYSEDANNTKVEKLVSTFVDSEERNGNSALLVVIIIILAIILCAMLCFMYTSYTKLVKLFGRKNEQVELIDT